MRTATDNSALLPDHRSAHYVRRSLSGYLIAFDCHPFSVFPLPSERLFVAHTLRIPRFVTARSFFGGMELIAQNVYFLFVRHIYW
jgi:hypothetical protein